MKNAIVWSEFPEPILTIPKHDFPQNVEEAIEIVNTLPGGELITSNEVVNKFINQDQIHAYYDFVLDLASKAFGLF